MMEDGDYSYVDDFKREAERISKDDRFSTEGAKEEEFAKRTGIHWYRRFKPVEYRHIG